MDSLYSSSTGIFREFFKELFGDSKIPFKLRFIRFSLQGNYFINQYSPPKKMAYL